MLGFPVDWDPVHNDTKDEAGPAEHFAFASPDHTTG